LPVFVSLRASLRTQCCVFAKQAIEQERGSRIGGRG
jgi:hypothetical protein